MFQIKVASHSHQSGPAESYVLGKFLTEHEAVEACQHVVRASIADVGAGLFSTMGDDSFIVATGGPVSQSGFSAWRYAKFLTAHPHA